MSLLSSILGKLLEKKQVEEDKFISQKARERDSFLKQFAQYINSAKRVVIFPHVNPDGDCLGGAFGMKEVIQDNYKDKKVNVVGDSKGVFPWLEMEFDDLSLDIDYSSSLAIILDSGSSDRMQKYQEFFSSPETQKWGAIIRIDHHEVKQDYRTDLSWVDGSYVACCEQLIQICDYYRWTMSSKAATYFYLGLLTDSGSFSNAEVSPRTFVIAAKALRAGADREFLNRNLKSTHPLEARFKGYILENFIQEDRMAWFFAKSEAVEKFKPYSITTNQVSALSNLEGNVLWMLFLEVSSSEIRVSFRSVGTLDVRKIAEEFGGGGHLNAAGVTIISAEQVKAIVIRARRLVKEFIDQGGEMSKDVLADRAREKFDESVNPSYRLELTPEEEQSLLAQKALLQETHDSLASQARIREAEEIVNSDAAFDTFLKPDQAFSDDSRRFDDDREIRNFNSNRAFDDSQQPPRVSSRPNDSLMEDPRALHRSKIHPIFDDPELPPRSFEDFEREELMASRARRSAEEPVESSRSRKFEDVEREQFFDPSRDTHSFRAREAFDDSRVPPRVSSEPRDIPFEDDRTFHASRANPSFDDMHRPPRVSGDPRDAKFEDDRMFHHSRTAPAFDDSHRPPRVSSEPVNAFNDQIEIRGARAERMADDSLETNRTFDNIDREKFFDPSRETHAFRPQRDFDDSHNPPRVSNDPVNSFNDDKEIRSSRAQRLADDSLNPQRTFDNLEREQFFDPSRDIHSARPQRAFDDSQQRPRVSSEPEDSSIDDQRVIHSARAHQFFDDSDDQNNQ